MALAPAFMSGNLSPVSPYAPVSPAYNPNGVSFNNPLATSGQATPQQSGGGFSLTDIPFSKLDGISNLNYPSFSGSSLGQGLDQFAFDTFGIGTEVATPFTGAAPFDSGIQGGITSGFTPVNVGAGIAGNFLADSVFGGDRGIGSSIGGGLGGIAGQALIPIPGVGALVGSFLGNAVGGLIGGNSDPHPAATFGSGFGSEGGTTGVTGFNADGTINKPDYQSKHLDTTAAKHMQGQVEGLTSLLAQQTGLDFSVINAIAGGVDDGTGFISLGDQPEGYNPIKYGGYTFDPNDMDSFTGAYTDFGNEILRRVAIENGVELTPEEIDAQVKTAMDTLALQQNQQTNFGSAASYMRGEPVIAGKSNVGNESFANFMTRYNETGATNPNYRENAINSPYLTAGAPQPQIQPQIADRNPVGTTIN